MSVPAAANSDCNASARVVPTCLVEHGLVSLLMLSLLRF
jgi:hypothetical protein